MSASEDMRDEETREREEGERLEREQAMASLRGRYDALRARFEALADDQRTGQADTAPQAHIDAVADALVQSIREHTGITKPDLVMWNYDVVKAAGIESRALLDSTDPAVHAALLDALTRHGVLPACTFCGKYTPNSPTHPKHGVTFCDGCLRSLVPIPKAPKQ